MHYSTPLFLLPLLTACGAGSTGNGPSIDYQTFASTEPVISSLVGRARTLSDGVVVGGNFFEPNVIEGTLDHGTGAVALDNGFFDSDGADGNGVLTDDSSPATSTTAAATEFAGIYEFVQILNITNQTGGAEGFYGIGTLDSDIPSTGDAAFIGEASGVGPNGVWTSVATTIVADFGLATLDIEATETLAGVTTALKVTGSTITGNAITGGAISATTNGIMVDVTSGGIFGTPIANVHGNFYGYDLANDTPDEIGIEIGAVGNDGAFDLTILAD